MRGFLVIVLTYVFLAVESPLLYELNLAFYAPDFALLAVLYVAMCMGTSSGVVTAALIGLLKDGFALGSPLGMYMHISVVTFFVVRAVASHINLRSLIPSILAALVASLLSSLLFLVLTLIFDRVFTDHGMVLRMMFPQALITAPFAPVLFLVFEKVTGLASRRRHLF